MATTHLRNGLEHRPDTQTDHAPDHTPKNAVEHLTNFTQAASDGTLPQDPQEKFRFINEALEDNRDGWNTLRELTSHQTTDPALIEREEDLREELFYRTHRHNQLDDYLAKDTLDATERREVANTSARSERRHPTTSSPSGRPVTTPRPRRNS